MTRRVWDDFLKHESPRDVPPPKGTIKGVPFVDTPPSAPPSKPSYVMVERGEYEDLQRAARANRWAVAVAGVGVALALIGVANTWR